MGSRLEVQALPTGDDTASKTIRPSNRGTSELGGSAAARIRAAELHRRRGDAAFCDQHKTITHKHGTHGEKSVDETTERTIPPSIQCLKVVLQATRQLSDLADKPPCPRRRVRRVPPRADRSLAHQGARSGGAGRAGQPRPQQLLSTFTSSANWRGPSAASPNSGVHLHILARDVGMEIIDPAERRMGCQSGAMCGDESDFAEAKPKGRRRPKTLLVLLASAARFAATFEPPRNLPAQKCAAEERAEQELAEKRMWPSKPPPRRNSNKPGTVRRRRYSSLRVRSPIPFEDPVERRRRHQIRLQQLREARPTAACTTFTSTPTMAPCRA